MKLLEIVRYEFSYQIKKIWPWIIFMLLVFFTFMFTRDGSVSEVLYSEFYLNSPFLIAGVSVLGGMVWLLTGAVITGDIAARDVAAGIYPITYTVPVPKWKYLSGRYITVLLVHLTILSAIPLGNLLAIYMPGVHPDLIGSFRPEAYLTAFFYIVLPNLLAATSLQFFLAMRTGKPMAAFLGSLILFFMGYVVSSIFVFQGKKDIANMLDPLGIHFIFSELSHLWTTIEKNHRLLEPTGTLLYNRLIWTGTAITIMTLTYLGFNFEHRTEQGLLQRMRALFGFTSKSKEIQPDSLFKPTSSISLPDIIRTFDLRFHFYQMKSLTWYSFKTIARSWAGIIMLTILPLLTLLLAIDGMSFNGVPILPTTSRILAEITTTPGIDRWVLVQLLIILIAGDLIWSDRDTGTDEIKLSMPGSSWVSLLSCFSALGLLIAIFLTLQTGAGILAQSIQGYQDVEVLLYLKVMFGTQLPEYLIFTALALAAHILVNNKYLGHLAGLTLLMIISLPWIFGIEYNLLLYGSGPAWSYSEMREFGDSVMPWLWFKLYWASWAFLLLVLARVFWNRGKASSIKERLQMIEISTSIKWTGLIASLLILTVGGFVFYNTNILNEYITSTDVDHQNARYEQLYAKFSGDKQPLLKESDLEIEIYPEEHKAYVKGSFSLVNQHSTPISTIHLATMPFVETSNISFDQASETLIQDEELGHHTYKLSNTIQPGDTVKLNFEVTYKAEGFKEKGALRSIAENGTYFANNWLPSIGYQSQREIITPGKRRKMGLPERPVVSSLYNSEVWENRDAGLDFKTGVTLTTTIGTSKGQVAVAPGKLLDSWNTEDRSYYKYSTDGPIGNQWDFFSADYSIIEKQWKDPYSDQTVDIKIYHHPEHKTGMETILTGIIDAMNYYTREFGPYEYNHLTIVERPGNGIGMHAEASLINFSEGSALFSPVTNEADLDLIYMVIMHEIAHQWTVPYAFVEGAPIMTESIAWYYALKAAGYARGFDKMQRMLQFMHSPYPYSPIRRGEPLLRGLDPYMAYRKGPFALYALSEYAGDDKINTALQKLLETHNKPGAPLATTIDLYNQIEAEIPDSLKYLLHDLFRVNVFWDLEVDNVTAKPLIEGTWEIRMEVIAHKIEYDSTGTETELPLQNEWIDIGAFAPVERSKGELSKPLYLKRHRLQTGRQTITLVLDSKPALVGVDPYHILDWEEKEDDNNIEGVIITN